MKKEMNEKDRERINRFAAAMDELLRREIIISQIDLADKMGINKNMVTNILKYRNRVSEQNITKLQTVSGGIFNLQWLRGESDVMFASELKEQPVVNDREALIKNQEEMIKALQKQIEDLRVDVESWRTMALMVHGGKKRIQTTTTGHAALEPAEQNNNQSTETK